MDVPACFAVRYTVDPEATALTGEEELLFTALARFVATEEEVSFAP